MIDTTLCYGIWSDPLHDAMCASQLAWLEIELRSSTADFLFVGGHYPVSDHTGTLEMHPIQPHVVRPPLSRGYLAKQVWSGCSHGNTEWCINTLLPMLISYNVTGYISGHDHCGEFIAPADAEAAGRDMVFVVSGTGDGCCYSEPNIAGLPPVSLKFMLSNSFNPSNASSGFAAIRVDSPPAEHATAIRTADLRFQFFSSIGAALLYTSPVILPRFPIHGPDGSILGMAAPDYAAAGLPRPSAVEPAGNYSFFPSSGVSMSLAALSAKEHSCFLPAKRELTIWLYSSTASNETWTTWYSELVTHRVNVTGVAPCSYLMNGAGQFTTQVWLEHTPNAFILYRIV
jgi:hypothetical protein